MSSAPPTTDVRSRRPSRRRSSVEPRPSNGNGAVGIGSDFDPTGAYELFLRFDDGREELRLADHLDFFARDPQTLEFRGQRWRIAASGPPSRAGFTAMLVCEPDR